MAKQYGKQFELDAVKHYQNHKDLGLVGCVSNLGISQQNLTRWKKVLKDSGDIECRCSDNYSSDEEKGIAQLKLELHDTRDEFNVLKKPVAFWKINRSSLYRSYSKGRENKRKNAPGFCLRNAENLRRIKFRILCVTNTFTIKPVKT